MADRAERDNLSALVTVTRGDNLVFERTYGNFDRTQPIRIASASKWLTAALLMTFVDEGALSLDEPLVTKLPAFDGEHATITLRMLLSHTSGIGQNSCIWDDNSTLAACTESIATDRLIDAPGTRFHYGNTSFQVAGHLAEVVGGHPFRDLFRTRIAEPLGLVATRFDNGTPTDNPTPAASGESSADDYARFLRMLLSDGTADDGRRVLGADAVAAMLTVQTNGKENPTDSAVAITGVPRYGLGCWIDEIDPNGMPVRVSGSGSYGGFPWIAPTAQEYGLVWLEDEAHADGRGVQRSSALASLAHAVP